MQSNSQSLQKRKGIPQYLFIRVYFYKVIQTRLEVTSDATWHSDQIFIQDFLLILLWKRIAVAYIRSKPDAVSTGNDNEVRESEVLKL